MNANSFYGLDDSTDYGVAVFGPSTTQDVLDEAERQSITPQDYIRSSVHEAIDNGLSGEADDVYHLLCDWVGVPR